MNDYRLVRVLVVYSRNDNGMLHIKDVKTIIKDKDIEIDVTNGMDNGVFDVFGMGSLTKNIQPDWLVFMGGYTFKESKILIEAYGVEAEFDDNDTVYYDYFDHSSYEVNVGWQILLEHFDLTMPNRLAS